MRYKTISLLFILFALTACSQQAKKVAYFKQHPEEVQKVAHDCIVKAMNHKNIEKDSTCMAVVAYEKEICEIKHNERALFYLSFDCNSKVQMMGLALRGY